MLVPHFGFILIDSSLVLSKSALTFSYLGFALPNFTLTFSYFGLAVSNFAFLLFDFALILFVPLLLLSFSPILLVFALIAVLELPLQLIHFQPHNQLIVCEFVGQSFILLDVEIVIVLDRRFGQGVVPFDVDLNLLVCLSALPLFQEGLLMRAVG